MFYLNLFHLFLQKYKDCVPDSLLSLTLIDKVYHSGYLCRAANNYVPFEETFVCFDEVPVLTKENSCGICIEKLNVKGFVNENESFTWPLNHVLKIIDVNEKVKQILKTDVKNLPYLKFREEVEVLNKVWDENFYAAEQNILTGILQEDSVLVKEVKETFDEVQKISLKKQSDVVFMNEFLTDCCEAYVYNLFNKDFIANETTNLLIDEVFTDSKKLFLDTLRSKKEWVLTNYTVTDSVLGDVTKFIFKRNTMMNNFFMVPLPVFDMTCSQNFKFWSGNVTLKEKLSDEDLEMFQVLVNDKTSVGTSVSLTSKELSSLIEIVLHV